ncbi:MAG: hypothetical protein ABRQ25_01945 [Clostridiaceae bacterium]
MNLVKKYWPIFIIALSLILLYYILVNSPYLKNKNSQFPETITSINLSYNTLIETKKYDFKSAYPVSQDSLNRLSFLEEKSASLQRKSNAYFSLLILYKEFFTDFNSLNNKSPSSQDYLKNLTAAATALDKLRNYYSTNRDIADKINYFTSFYDYNHKLLTFLADSSKEELNSDIIKSIQMDYTNSISIFYENMTTLSQDLGPALTYCYENKGSLRNILNDIYKKQGELEELKNYISSISVPQNQYLSYTDLNSVIAIGSDYLENMKVSLISESDTPSYSNDISTIYSDAFIKRNCLITALEEYKKKYSDIIK